jgi:hypothetical protein
VVSHRVPSRHDVASAQGISVASIDFDDIDVPRIPAQTNARGKAVKPSLALDSNAAFQSNFYFCQGSQYLQNPATIARSKRRIGDDTAETDPSVRQTTATIQHYGLWATG